MTHSARNGSHPAPESLNTAITSVYYTFDVEFYARFEYFRTLAWRCAELNPEPVLTADE
ncbi:hypothetical protein J6590_030403 [Homalodisca vitripennis]|nr:hypothetical protein J6590_030403 [Homalodisca vitripennis]